MRFGVTLPPFNAWSDPRAIMAMAADAEVAGWNGFFLWDHVSWNPAWGTPSIVAATQESPTFFGSGTPGGVPS
jgi:hypothetical protein